MLCNHLHRDGFPEVSQAQAFGWIPLLPLQHGNRCSTFGSGKRLIAFVTEKGRRRRQIRGRGRGHPGCRSIARNPETETLLLKRRSSKPPSSSRCCLGVHRFRTKGTRNVIHARMLQRPYVTARTSKSKEQDPIGITGTFKAHTRIGGDLFQDMVMQSHAGGTLRLVHRETMSCGTQV